MSYYIGSPRYELSGGFSLTQHQLRGLLNNTNAAARGWNREKITHLAQGLGSISSKIPSHITAALGVRVFFSDIAVGEKEAGVLIRKEPRTIVFQLGTLRADHASTTLAQSEFVNAMASFIFDPENTFDTDSAGAGYNYNFLDISTRSPFLKKSSFTISPEFEPYVDALLHTLNQPGDFIKEEVVIGDPHQYLGAARISSLSPSLYTLMAEIRYNTRQVASDKIAWLIAPHLLGIKSTVASLRSVADKAESTREATLENAWGWTRQSIALAARSALPLALNQGGIIADTVRSTLSALARHKAQALLLMSYFGPGYSDNNIRETLGTSLAKYKPGALNPAIPSPYTVHRNNFFIVSATLEDTFLREVEYLYANCLIGYLDLCSQVDFA